MGRCEAFAYNRSVHARAPTNKFSLDPASCAELGTAWRVLPPLTIVLLVFVTFVPALAAGFVGWDDDDLLFQETRYRTFSAPSLIWMFTTTHTGHFQPLTWLSFCVDHAVWGLAPFGYHLTNVALHAASAVVFYHITRRLLSIRGLERAGTLAGEGFDFTPDLGRMAMSSRRRAVIVGSVVAALLFANHPLRVESVAWVAERRDVLSVFFFLLAVAAYLRYAEHRSDRSSRAWYTAVVMTCGLSLLAKATAVMLPFVLLILDVYPFRRFVRQSDASSRTPAAVWIEKVPLFALAAVTGLLAVRAQQAQGAMVPLAEHGLVARCVQACYGLSFYVWKTLVPTNLGPLYEIPPREVLIQSYAGWGLLGVGTLLGTAWVARRRCPGVLAALGVYGVLLAPVVGFAQSGPQLVADRYSYLACGGFAILAGAAVVRAMQSPTVRRRPALRGVLILLLAGGIIGLQQLTFRQCDIWRSPRTLWSHGVKVSPDSSVAHANLADALATGGDFGVALSHYRRAIELQPNDVITVHHFAKTLVKAGRLDEAAAAFHRVLQLDPDRPGVHLALAEVLMDGNRPLQAAELLRQRLARVPTDREVLSFLAELLATHPDHEVRNGQEAVVWAERLRDAHGEDDGRILLVLATALSEAGRFDEGVAVAERALHIAQGKGDQRLSAELERRLTLFRAGRPYHFGDG